MGRISGLATMALDAARVAFIDQYACEPERLDVPMLPGWTEITAIFGMKIAQRPDVHVPRMIAGGFELHVFGIQGIEEAEGVLWEKP